MRLNQREIIFITAGVFLIFFLGVYFLMIEPMAKRRDQLKDITARQESNLVEMKVLAAKYKALSDQQSRLDARVKARGAGFAPFSYLENLAKQAGLQGKLESMTPVSSSSEGRESMTVIEVQLSSIGLNELVRFLYSIENSDKVLFINNLYIRSRYLSPEKLDVTLRVATPVNS